MNLLEMTREEALAQLEKIGAAIHDQGHCSKEEEFFIEQIEDCLERMVIFNIRERQAALKNLHCDKYHYRAVWGGKDLTPGCESCLKGSWTQIRSSCECNAACPFCYYHEKKDDYIASNRFRIANCQDLLSTRDIQAMFELQGHKMDGVAWVSYEPLMDVPKILPVIKTVHECGKHQWLYTNGINATPQIMEQLAAAGLDELRFNLAATNCSEQVLEHMKIARGLFKYLVIESPMYTKFFNIFMGKRERILATGVQQINLAELHLNNHNLDSMKEEGPLYTYRHGYVSPIKSRQLTYEVMATAERENWANVVINDCSNELKLRRGMANLRGDFGKYGYHAEVLFRMRVWKKALELFDLREAAALPDVT